MRREREVPGPSPDHGPHTLKVWRGTVVGTFGNDVFVELGPRMQGVITANHFAKLPAIGEQYDFTLRGLEEGLWSLALSTEQSLVTWREMEVGSLVQARVVRAAPGGLEVKIGPLHGFLPKSHTGLARDEKPDQLVGRVATCEVIEVDPERQRVTVSRRLPLQRERESLRQRHVDQLKIGQVVHGHVVRIEDYGAFVAFGHGMEGLVHVSNLSHERVGHPSELVRLGQTLELKVLHIRQGGKRIGLGLKQMRESPWRALERTAYVGQILSGVVVNVLEFGAFVAVCAGVQGLVPASEAGIGRDRPLRSALHAGQRVSVRVLQLDAENERLALSLVHGSGAPIHPEEAENARDFDEIARARSVARLSQPLGDHLRRAIGG